MMSDIEIPSSSCFVYFKIVCLLVVLLTETVYIIYIDFMSQHRAATIETHTQTTW